MLKEIEAAMMKRREDLNKRNFQVVVLTDLAPYNLLSKSDNRTAWLVSQSPLKISFEGDNKNYDVNPEWIMFEHKTLKNFVKETLNCYLIK